MGIAPWGTPLLLSDTNELVFSKQVNACILRAGPVVALPLFQMISETILISQKTYQKQVVGKFCW